MPYTDTRTWLRSLAAQGDTFDGHRERLRQAYFSFRNRIGQLIQTIPADIPGLTVHDLTHLDALWEMADLLTAGEYDLNPAEAFVLGGAILLHDSAMTVCAYVGGIDEVRQSPEYADALAQLRSLQPLAGFPTAEAQAVAEALRVKHASKAEHLTTQKWVSPIDKSEVYLIDDAELRDHYGHSIGRIAHSHHWNIVEVPKQLGTTLGAFSGFPTAWTIDQVKIALLLRCVDAMQIDDRRAPRLLATVRSINAQSMEHWRFQNKLAQPHLKERRLVYTSKTPFGVNEAPAWNLCFDTLQMIDRELRDTNDLHLQKGLPQFCATGVAGAGSAEALAEYIQVEGWRPLPLNLKVSNVPHLARTLGGRDLYENPLTPLRELIQNSADAIEARTLVDTDFSLHDGAIAIRFVETDHVTTLEIDDNGIGMSEQVLTTALLDFGFSFWKSAAARSEFPGIQQAAGRFRGRYGIGFFSVFMWSSEVQVCSRRFNEGVDDSRVLEFRQGIESRPLLRAAATSERSSKWTTRIRLRLKSDFLKGAFPSGEDASVFYHRGMYRLRRPEPFAQQTWLQRAKLLCGALPIKVTLEAAGRVDEVSLPAWRECSNSSFTDFFADVLFMNPNEDRRFISTLTNLSEPPPLGGRCFMSPYRDDNAVVAVYEKGIFVGFGHYAGISGVVEANATNAARDRYSQLSVTTDKVWMNAMRAKVFAACRHIGEILAVQKLLARIDQPDPNQPLFIMNRELRSLSEVKRKVEETGVFSIRLLEERDDVFVWKAAEYLSTIVGLHVDEQRVFPLVAISGQVEPGMDVKKNIEDPKETLFVLLREFRDVIGPSAEVEARHHEAQGYHNDYIDIRIFADPNP